MIMPEESSSNHTDSRSRRPFDLTGPLDGATLRVRIRISRPARITDAAGRFVGKLPPRMSAPLRIAYPPIYNNAGRSAPPHLARMLTRLRVFVFVVRRRETARPGLGGDDEDAGCSSGFLFPEAEHAKETSSALDRILTCSRTWNAGGRVTVPLGDAPLARLFRGSRRAWPIAQNARQLAGRWDDRPLPWHEGLRLVA